MVFITVFLGNVFNGVWGFLLAFIGLLAGYMWALHYIIEFNKNLESLKVRQVSKSCRKQCVE